MLGNRLKFGESVGWCVQSASEGSAKHQWHEHIAVNASDLSVTCTAHNRPIPSHCRFVHTHKFQGPSAYNGRRVLFPTHTQKNTSSIPHANFHFTISSVSSSSFIFIPLPFSSATFQSFRNPRKHARRTSSHIARSRSASHPQT